MTRPAPLAALLVALVLAVAPPVALAQSGAGDDQYQDPFAGSSKSGSGGSGGSSSSSSSSSSGSSTPAQSSTPQSSTPSTSSSSGTTSQGTQGATAGSTGAGQAGATSTGSTGAGQLPRTGFDVLPVAVVGVVLVVAGLALLRRTAHDRR